MRFFQLISRQNQTLLISHVDKKKYEWLFNILEKLLLLVLRSYAVTGVEDSVVRARRASLMACASTLLIYAYLESVALRRLFGGANTVLFGK